MLSEDLKEITCPEHQASEKKMIVVLKKIETREDYIRMLHWLYGFHAPMEDLIRKYLKPDSLPDIDRQENTRMWQSYKDFLDKPRTIEQKTAIIDAAKATFITFKTWIERHELQPQL